MADEQQQENQDATLDKFNRAFAHGVPHNHALGLTVVGVGPGEATMKLPYDRKLVGNPQTGVLHGGAISSAIDATCGAAVFMKLQGSHRIATLDLRIDYLRPATPELDVLARATCYKVTRHVAFVRAVAFHGDESDPIASATGTFMLFGDHRSSLATVESGT